MYSIICHNTQILRGILELTTLLCLITTSFEAASCPPDTNVFGFVINGSITFFKACESRIESASMVQIYFFVEKLIPVLIESAFPPFSLSIKISFLFFSVITLLTFFVFKKLSLANPFSSNSKA